MMMMMMMMMMMVMVMMMMMSCVSLLSLFLAVSWVGLQCVIVVFPCYTHVLSGGKNKINSIIPEFK